MLAHYSHVRLDAKRKAVSAMSGGGSGGGYGTNDGTKPHSRTAANSQVIKMVDEKGFEPSASSLRTRRSPS
jgi:hypothetical protein